MDDDDEEEGDIRDQLDHNYILHEYYELLCLIIGYRPFQQDERDIWWLFFFLAFPSTLEGIAAGLTSASSGGDFNSTFKGGAFLLRSDSSLLDDLPDLDFFAVTGRGNVVS